MKKNVKNILGIAIMGLLQVHFAKSQVYKAAKEIPGGTISSTLYEYQRLIKSEDGNLYFVLPPKNVLEIKAFKIGKTNGSVTTVFKSLTWPDSARFNTMMEWNGDFYLGGLFRKNGNTMQHGLLKFDGANWDTVPGFKDLNVTGLKVVSGNLYVAAYTQSYNTRIVELKSNGNINVIYDYYLSSAYELTSLKNNLYLFADKFIKYNGSKWDTLNFTYVPSNHNRIHFKGADTAIYFLSNRNLYMLKDDNSFTKLDTIKMNSNIVKGAMVYDEVMLTGSNGQYVYSVYNLGSKQEKELIGITIDIYGSNNKAYVCRTLNKGVEYYFNVRLLMDGNAGLVSGIVYEDLNTNCTFNGGVDNIYPNRKGYFYQGADTFTFLGNDTGYYDVLLPVSSKSYQVQLTNKYCNGSSFNCGDTPTVANATVYQNYIPFNFQSSQKDVALNLVGGTGWRARQGFTEYYDLHYSNLGTTTEDLEIELKFPDSITFTSSSLAPKSSTSNSYIFEINGVAKQTSGYIRIYFKISAQKSLGATLKFTCRVGSILNDLDSTNNLDTLVQKVVAAFDPNLKTSQPEGIILKPVTNIKYHINFQNLGTDTAYRVIVVDTFMPNFPLYKLQMTGRSHPYQMRVEPGNVIVWEFDNIKLPPGNKESQKNQGYVSFEAPLSTPTKIGTVISNRAHIYFDYQKPVITDWCKIIHSEWGVNIQDIERDQKSLFVYPNPVSGILNVNVLIPGTEVLVLNALGSVLKSVISQDQWVSMDLSGLPLGVYVIKAGNDRATAIKQ